MSKVFVPPYIAALSPYRAGRAIASVAREKGLKRIVKLASNENPLPPPASFFKAAERVFTVANRYPEPTAFDLRAELAKVYKVSPDEIICGNGSDSLLFFAFLTFGGFGAEVVTSEGTFVSTFLHTRKLNQNLKCAPLKNHGFNLEAIASLITPMTRIVYLPSINNPTATQLDRKQLQAFLAKVPKTVLVIYDEAYHVYGSGNSDYPDGMDFRQDNLLILRTFSKSHALAGERVGYGIGHPDLISELYKTRLPFEPGLVAQYAALAALRDKSFVKRTLALNRQSMNLLTGAFRDLGLEFTQPHANFSMLIFKDEAQALRFNDGCLNRGLILRPLHAFHIPNGVRINSGTLSETKFAIRVIREVMADMSAEIVPFASAELPQVRKRERRQRV